MSNRSFQLKQTHFRRNKYFRFGGNRKDPLNLNELIQKKKQSTINHHQIEINGNDRQVEILLQPNIFDPLCLDISSYSNHIDSQQVPEWR